MNSYQFNCSKCGSCCRNLNLNELYAEFDRGDGICKHFDETKNLCEIYSTRPDICNVMKMYEIHFKQFYSLKEYIDMNESSCKKLRRITIKK
ncbi:MAG: YkgJ family cysteine cluster protein [Bacteroidales bacterium]|nr:YkgJ family cysteine cluster protein [Bacteroidales bacterium]